MFSKRNAVSLHAHDGGRKNPAPQQIRFTARQHEVLKLLCQGLSNKMICRRLNIAAGTTKAHIAVILRELGVSSRLQAVVAAHNLGLVDDEAEEEGRRRTEPRPVLRLFRHDNANLGPSMAHFGSFAGK